MDLFVGLAILFERVGVRAEKNGSGDEVDDVATATEPTMLLVEPQFNAQVFKARVVALRIVCDKISNAILESILVDYLANTVGQVFSTVATFNPWQTEEKRTELPFVIKKVYGKAK